MPSLDKFDKNLTARGLKRIINAGKYSYDGLCAAWQSEAAFRQLMILHIFLISTACVLAFEARERAFLIALSFISLIVELLNSAIEATIDRISLDIHPLSKQAKDLGSAAQLLMLVLLFISWILLLT